MTDVDREKYYFQKMLEYCERIENAQKRFGYSYEEYLNDADYRDVICMNIFQIGELTNQISEETKASLSDIPWRQMHAIRNILAHAYIKVDDEIVWDTLANDIPSLKKRLYEII